MTDPRSTHPADRHQVIAEYEELIKALLVERHRPLPPKPGSTTSLPRPDLEQSGRRRAG